MAMTKESESGGGGGGLLSPPRRLILVLPLNSCLITLSALTGSLECQLHTIRDVSAWMINNVRGLSTAESSLLGFWYLLIVQPTRISRSLGSQVVILRLKPRMV